MWALKVVSGRLGAQNELLGNCSERTQKKGHREIGSYFRNFLFFFFKIFLGLKICQVKFIIGGEDKSL